MYRAVLFSCRCLPAVIVGIVLSSPASAADDAEGHTTPRAVWNTYHQAVTKGDFGKAFACLTPGAQEEHLEKCLLSSLMIAGGVDSESGESRELRHVRTRLEKVLRTHGIDPIRLCKEINAAQENARATCVDTTEEEDRAFLLKHLKGDRKEFCAAATGLISEFQACLAEEYRKAAVAFDDESEQEEPGVDMSGPDVEILGVKTRKDRAFMILRRRIPTSWTATQRVLRVRYATETHHFRRIEGKWFIASENNEPVDAPLHVVKESSLPFRREFQFDCGEAVRIELPCGKKVALWCSGTPFIGQVMGHGTLTMSWGEKPFRSLPSKWRPLPDGGRASDGWDSYIRLGGVTTSSTSSSWCRRELFAEGYLILIDEDKGEEDKLSVTIQIRRATLSESLHGDARREHYVKQLGADSPAKRMEALKELQAMIAEDSVFLCGDALDRTVVAVRRLTEDTDPEVSKTAVDVLCEAGDERTLLGLMTPAPKETLRSIMGGERIADWNLRRQHDSVIHRAATFFDSEDPALVGFAVGFFARDSNPMVKEQMLKALDHESAEIRLAAVGSFRSYCDGCEDARLLVERLDDENEEVVLRALGVANWMIEDLDVNKVVSYLGHPSRHIREKACYALADCWDPKPVAPLLEATRDKEPRVRSQAALTLGRMKAEESLERLIEMLNDPVAHVREDAVYGLRSLEDPKMLPALKRLLETEKDEDVRRNVQRTLDQW